MTVKTMIVRFPVVVCILLTLYVADARAQETKLKWMGHAAFSITTPRGKVLLIDPWLTNPSNPEAKDGKDPFASLAKVDYILITHGHRDHVGEAVEIAKRTGAMLIANPELAAKQAIPHHFGTFPGITQNASEFAAALKPRGIAFREMKPGETLTFQGNRIK